MLVAAVVVVRLDFFLTVLRARTNTSRGRPHRTSPCTRFVPDILSTNPFLGLGLNNFAVYYEFVTGRPDFGPHSFYVATIVETGLVGAALLAAFVVWIFRRLGAARRIGRALSAAGDPLAARVRPVAWGMTAALVATLVANVFYLDDDLLLLLRVRDARRRPPGRGSRRAARMKVVVLTTSYPRGPDDVAGVFVRDAVEHLRAGRNRRRRRLAGVVSPLRARVRGRHRRQPPAATVEGAAAPAFLASYSRAARRAARDADLVHAHWLPSALPAVKTRKPFVLQLWGTDVELARRARWAARLLVRRARLVLCPSRALVDDATSARRTRRARHRERRRDPGRGRSAGRAAARALRREALRGEGRRGAARGDAWACRG